MLRDPREHPRADFFAIVKRENYIGPPVAAQRPVGAGLSHDPSPDPEQGCQRPT